MSKHSDSFDFFVQWFLQFVVFLAVLVFSERVHDSQWFSTICFFNEHVSSKKIDFNIILLLFLRYFLTDPWMISNLRNLIIKDSLVNRFDFDYFCDNPSVNNPQSRFKTNSWTKRFLCDGENISLNRTKVSALCSLFSISRMSIFLNWKG